MAALIPVLTTTGVSDIEGSAYALSGLAAAINPTTAIGLYTQTIILYIAAYIIWRLIVQITRSIPSTPGIDTNHTIIVIDILGLTFRIPLERCATFEASLFYMHYPSDTHICVSGFSPSGSRTCLKTTT
jgi:hypothetical protein